MSQVLVFVHGWSVTNLDTYGQLPERLQAEAAQKGIQIEVEEIFLGRYISFHDEVRVSDISRAFRAAVQEQLGDLLSQKKRFACITHSTGGPVIRDWWQRYYADSEETCPMSHLVMLAPANYGSALACLGKGRLSRLKSWIQAVEPGQGVLDWLSLGSSEAWALNKEWILNGENAIGENGFFPFVLTGQDIDRKFYDHLNSYTGETGSDGVVRVATANLQGRYVKLVQDFPQKNQEGKLSSGEFKAGQVKEAVKTPLRVLTGKSHSGDEMGIMKSVKFPAADRDPSSETIRAILDCILVRTNADYEKVNAQFDEETKRVQATSRLEKVPGISTRRYFIHDRFSMVIFRVLDSEGKPVRDYDLVLTAGTANSPDDLPEGFFADRQRNAENPETITYFFNYDAMKGCAAVTDPENGKEIRPAWPGAKTLGLEIHPRPDTGFVRYLPCSIVASEKMLDDVLAPNMTTLVEICLQRVVSKEVFRKENLGLPQDKWNFKQAEEGDEIAG